MRRATILLLLLFACSTAALSATPPDPVKDCPPRLLCFTLAEAAEIDRKLITLERDLALARVKKLRRFGWNFGPGGGVSLDPDSPVGVRVDLGLYATFGFRF